MGEWGAGGEEKGNCTYIPASMAEEEVAKLIVGNDSGMCKASFAGDVPRRTEVLCVKRDEERDEDEKRERHVKRERGEI